MIDKCRFGMDGWYFCLHPIYGRIDGGCQYYTRQYECLFYRRRPDHPITRLRRWLKARKTRAEKRRKETT
jgi:hypothetical protein